MRKALVVIRWCDTRGCVSSVRFSFSFFHFVLLFYHVSHFNDLGFLGMAFSSFWLGMVISLLTVYDSLLSLDYGTGCLVIRLYDFLRL
jgi:hypothetical protein